MMMPYFTTSAMAFATFGIKGIQEIDVAYHHEGLVEGSDEVLAAGVVDRGFSPDA